VDLVVFRGKQSQSFTLYYAHTMEQQEQRINSKTVFGYDIVLLEMRRKTARLGILRTPPEGTPKGQPQQKATEQEQQQQRRQPLP
jgi:hypothetical protein